MKNKKYTVVCAWCNGCGSIELAGKYATTLLHMTLHKREVNAVELAAAFGIRPTAMNNRLSRLEDLGFLVSRTLGRKRLYSVKKEVPI